jgi:hypothetical protein
MFVGVRRPCAGSDFYASPPLMHFTCQMLFSASDSKKLPLREHKTLLKTMRHDSDGSPSFARSLANPIDNHFRPVL